MPYDLIAVGDVMLDGSLPEPRPGHHVHGQITLRPGGSAVNAALAAAKLGARAAVVGRVGSDAAGRLVREALKDAGVQSLLAADETLPTGCFLVAGTAIVADPGASARLSVGDLPTALNALSVLVSGYSLLQRPSEAAARAAIGRARTEWLAIDVASAALVRNFGVPRFFDATASVDVLLANAEEALALTGADDEAAASELAKRYPIACVKLGPRGAVAVAGETVARAAALPLDSADTAGAGDAFAAGLLVALTRGADLDGAVQQGCELARTAIADRTARS